MTSDASAFVDRSLLDRLPPAHLRAGRTPGLAELALPTQLNVADRLLADALAAGMRQALVTPSDSWSLDRLEETSRRLATRFRRVHGLVPGNRLLIRCPNGPLLVTAILAANLAGLIAVPSPPGLRAAELVPVLLDARPDLVLTTMGARAEIDSASMLSGLVPEVLAVDENDVDAIGHLVTGHTPLDPGVATYGSDPALMLFTSGTTDRPKATLHSHHDIMALTRFFGRRIFIVGPGDIVIGSPSLAFAYGFGVLFAASLSQGAAIRLLAPAHSAALSEALADGSSTVLVTAPTAYRKLLAAPEAWRGSKLRLAISAGEPLAPDLARQFEAKTRAPLLDALGSTEMLGPYVVSRPAEDGGAGRAVPGYRLRISGERERSAEEGPSGRLAVIGPTGCIWLDEADARAACREGWTLTNDLARIDGGGRVTLLGRADDMVLSAGHTISTTEIEAALSAHPDVAECAVIGAPDAERGEIVIALVRPAVGVVADQALEDAILAEMSRRLASWKCPRRIVFRDRLPHTATGKIRRSALQSLLDEDI